MVTLNSNHHMIMRVGLRAVEFVCALVAMSTLGASFRSIPYRVGSNNGSVMFGSHSSNFSLLMNYTALVYSLFVLVAVERMNLVPRFQVKVDLILDGVMATLLFIAGLAVATSDFASDCYSVVRCTNMKASAAFSFIGMVAFLASLTLTLLTRNKGPGRMANTQLSPQDAVYVEVATPSTREGTQVNAANV